MDRRHFIISSLGLGLASPGMLSACKARGAPPVAATQPAGLAVPNQTHWNVRAALGLDACFALTVAGADESVLQVEYNLDAREELRAMLGDEGCAHAETFMQAIAASGSRATPGAGLALVASAGELATVEDVIHTFTVEGVLEEGLKPTGMLDRPRAAENLKRIRPIAVAALEHLQSAGFEDWWTKRYEAKLQTTTAALTGVLSDVDLVSELNRYRAKAADPEIVVYLSKLAEPHGIKLIGQCFVTSPDYEFEIVRRNAAHEMLHPNLNRGDPQADAILARLDADPLLRSIRDKADPAYGYTSDASSVRGLAEEGSVQALEAILNENLGQGRDQAAYWREQDGGMHLFAAATYVRLKTSGFAETGGDYLTWLSEQVQAGELTGELLAAHAASIVGKDAVDRWR